jgi:hypothetical protein
MTEQILTGTYGDLCDGHICAVDILLRCTNTLSRLCGREQTLEIMRSTYISDHQCIHCWDRVYLSTYMHSDCAEFGSPLLLTEFVKDVANGAPVPRDMLMYAMSKGARPHPSSKMFTSGLYDNMLHVSGICVPVRGVSFIPLFDTAYYQLPLIQILRLWYMHVVNIAGNVAPIIGRHVIPIVYEIIGRCDQWKWLRCNC